MENSENKSPAAGKEVTMFEHMIGGAERINKPWKLALILTNLFWAVVFTVFLMFAYLTPTEYEQSQMQDFPEQRQEQEYKYGGP